MFKVDISGFGLGQHQVKLESDPGQEISFRDEKFSSIEVDLFLLIKREQILAHVEAAAQAQLICDRTLQPFEQEVSGSYSVLFAIPETALPAEKTDEYEEVREWHPSDTVLDVTDVVRDTLILALPARRVAPGAEDEEIPTVFGEPDESEEPAVDPRWSKLQELKKSLDDGVSAEDQK